MSGTNAGAAGMPPASTGLKSRAVYTACTPGDFAASVTSMVRMRACGNGLRTTDMCSMPVSRMSSM